MSIDADAFLDAINSISQQSIDSTPIDLTVNCEVRAVYNVEIGEYKVTHDGNTFSAFSSDPLVVYQVGEDVYVLVPQGDFSQKKLIIGRSAYENNATYSDITDITNYYITVGPNWFNGWYTLDHTPLEICSVLLDSKANLVHPNANWADVGFARDVPTPIDTETRYPSAYMSQEALNNGDTQLQTYAECDYVMISANFRTEFLMTHSSGQYGLRVECLVDNPLYVSSDNPQYDPDQPQYQIVTFDLSFANFIGAPYQYIVDTPNKAAFKIDKGSLRGLARVSLYQDGHLLSDIPSTYDEQGNQQWLPENSNYSDNNIFVSNIIVSYGAKIDLTDEAYLCYIEAPHGRNVYDADPPDLPTGVGSVDLVVRLFYAQQDLISTDTCRIYWFREKLDEPDTTIMEANETSIPVEVDDYGNTFYDYCGPGWTPIEELMEDNGDIYDINFDTLTVTKDAVPWKWQYKVVVVYNDQTTLSATYDGLVTRYDSKYDLVLEQFVSDDLQTVYLRIKDNNDVNPLNNNAPNNEWFGTWWLLRQDGAYYPLRDGIALKGPLDINEWLTDTIVTFKVQCYDPYEADPDNTGIFQNQVDEVGDLTTTISTGTESSLQVDWQGTFMFNYNSDGSIKPWVGSQDNTIWAQILWVEGQATDYRVEMLAPDGIVLGAREYYETESEAGQGYSLESSMMNNMFVDVYNTIHFHVEEKYDMYKTSNTYTLRVTTVAGEVYTSQKTVEFLKDGDQGTQGSDWTAPIKPCSYKDITAKFVEELQYPAPLVINADATQDMDFKLYMRPFVQKNGTMVEEMDRHQGYYYKVFWDVRYPQNATVDSVKNSSYLRLHHVDGTVFMKSDLKNSERSYTAGETNPSSGTSEQANGFQGYTEYRGNVSDDYATLEVRYLKNPTGATLEECHYNFVVWAEIDIYQGTYDEITKTIVGTGSKVATINSVWPVDVFFNTSGIEFDPKLVYTNWPQYVDYNATGYNPTVFQDKLLFRYGEGAYQVIDPPQSYPPQNLTYDIQTIDPLSSTKDGVPVDQFYKPKTYFFWEEGYNGALSTDPSNSPFEGGRYVRNQIFRLNAYGNVDINAWDGQGIDINEDAGTIFAPTIGAGYKDPYTNTFTGVIMGIDKSQLKYGRWGTYSASTDINALVNSGNRQGYDSDDPRKYMVGIYGYQEGISSFGIMENGTAFFGRADRGGRIIIDGYNATIYGGANGELTDPTIGDPMWNTMRLTLVDLTHQTGDTSWDQEDKGTSDQAVAGTETDGVMQGFRGHYFGDASQPDVNTFPDWFADIWKNAYIRDDGTLPYWLEGEDAPAHPINYWDQGDTPYEEGQLTGFGPSRASTTPAMEIGQHQHGLMPGLIPWEDFETVMEDLWIPGDRNFMITYDGTMWAMNGVFMGNVVGSNIVGGRIQGGEIGIGKPSGSYQPYDYYELTNGGIDSWPLLLAPTEEKRTYDYTTSGGTIPPTAFYVDYQGNLTARSIHIYGGSIQMGHFHVVGPDGGDGEYGHIIQFGETDLIGPVHVYGNLGIGPNLGSGGTVGSNYGNLYQTKGQVGFGIAKDPLPPFHSKVAGPDGKMAPVPYASTTLPGTGAGLESIAFFGIDTVPENAPQASEDTPYQGHFWPMYYRYSSAQAVTEEDQIDNIQNAYMTTMDMYKSKSLETLLNMKNRPEGDNYFRVSPYGAEACLLYIRKEWQAETGSSPPKDETCFGYFGRMKRHGNFKVAGGGADAMGIKSWNRSPLVLDSDSELSFWARNSVTIAGTRMGASDSDPATYLVDEDSDPFGFHCVFGGIQGDTTNRNEIFFRSCVDAQKFMVLKATEIDWSGAVAGGTANDVGNLAGLILDPSKDGIFLFTKQKNLHIFNGATDGIADTPEILLAESGELNIHAAAVGSFSSKTEIKIGLNSAATSHVSLTYPNDAANKSGLFMSMTNMYLFAKAGDIHIFNGDTDGNTATPEVAVRADGQIVIYAAGRLNLDAQTEVWIGTNPAGTGHNTPVNYMKMTTTSIDFFGAYATADNQHHIYARFG